MKRLNCIELPSWPTDEMDGEILVLLQNINLSSVLKVQTLMYILASLLIYNSLTKTAKKFLF